MGTMKEQLEKNGFKLTAEDTKKVKDSLEIIKRSTKTTVCRKCGETIKFVEISKGRSIPHDLEGTPHWQTCPSSAFSQKKASLDIMKKLGVLFILKYGLDLEKEAGLTKREVKIVQATLERAFKEEATTPKAPTADDGKVDDDVQFVPVPCDSVGDPDEERAPDEELVHKAEEKISEEKNIDKGVVKIIAEPIPEPEGTPVAAKS